MRVHGDESFERYNYRVNSDAGEESQLMECHVTHATGFFRKPEHCNWLWHTGLAMRHARKNALPIKVWSAASSMGSELWRSAMENAEYQSDERLSYSAYLLGTDISSSILKRARSGIYTEAEISGIPADYRQLFLRRSSEYRSTFEQRFRIANHLLKTAQFKRLNLLKICDAGIGVFDLDFLRNVLIYFKTSDQQSVFDTVVSKLRTGGILMVGHTESLGIKTNGVTRLAAAIYRKD